MREEFSAREKLLERVNATLTKCLLALWPEENKAWGMAFAAERNAIKSPQKQFRWLLGGIPILLREQFKSFLRSLGRPLGESAKPGGGRGARTPRLVVALLFLLFVFLLWQPAARTVFRSVSQGYTQNGWDSSHWAEVERLQDLAQKNLASQKRDPQLLAFVSVSYRDEGKRLAMADAAIQADPKLIWIDYQNAVFPWNGVGEQHSLSEARIDRLVGADPDNAMLYLLRAESIALRYRQSDAAADPAAQRIAAWGSAAHGDPGWLAAMDAAFHAPRYDAYDAKLFELSRDVMERYSVNDPRILSSIMGRRPINQYLAVHDYAQVVLDRSAKAERAGDPQSAISDCFLVVEFAKHLRSGNFYRVETWTANDIEAQALPKLQALYENSGRREEAKSIAARIRQNRQERASFASEVRLRSHSRRSSLNWSRSEWAALFIQISVLGIWVLLPLSLVSIILLWIMRGRFAVTSGVLHSRLSLLSDLCPVLLAGAAVLLFVSYMPYDQAYRQLLQQPLSAETYEQFTSSANVPFLLPTSVRIAVASLLPFSPQGRFILWSMLTIVLTVLAVLIVVRQLPKRRIRPEQRG